MSQVKASITPKQFLMNILNGLALGTVVSLIPGALFGELLKVLLPVFPQGQTLLQAVTMSNSMMGIVIGVIIGLMFKFTPIQAASVGLAVIFAGGAPKFDPAVQGIVFSGTGDIINMGLTAALAVAIILLIGDKAKAYTVLVIPTVSLLVAGGIGRTILPYVQTVTVLLGQAVASLLTLQPILMSILIAMIFCFLIVSPITTVGIAVAIGISGIGSAAANLGICAAGFGLAIAGWKVNSAGTSVAHFIGSPKLSMANVLTKPKILLPMLCSAAILGALGAIFNLQGTPMSAGFGFSGLVGPINALNLAPGGWTMGNIVLITLIFLVAPVILGFIFNHLFVNVFKIIQPEDYKITI